VCDTCRRNRTSFGNPFRKGEKDGLASDEIEGEAEAAECAGVKQGERRRRRAPSSANRRGAKGASSAAGYQSEGATDDARSPEPSPSSSPNLSPVASREQSPAFGHEGFGREAHRWPASLPSSSPGRTWTPGSSVPGHNADDERQPEAEAACTTVEGYMGMCASSVQTGSASGHYTLQVTQANRATVKLQMMRLLKRSTMHSTRLLLQKAKGLRGEAELVKRLLAQLASFAQEWRKNDLAIALVSLSQ